MEFKDLSQKQREFVVTEFHKIKYDTMTIAEFRKKMNEIMDESGIV